MIRGASTFSQSFGLARRVEKFDTGIMRCTFAGLCRKTQSMTENG